MTAGMQLLLERVQGALNHEQATEIANSIHADALRTSRHLDRPNFTAIHPDDLRWLFDNYDSRFLGGACRQAIGEAPLHFRFSRRMTSAGGKTVRTVYHRVKPQRVVYEIVISSTLLYQTFLDVDRPVSVAGVVCRDRLDALQRIFEHELVHLMEMLLWKDSSCSRDRFQGIAQRLFRHREHTHQLITPAERAAVRFGIRAGDRVRFRFEGQHLQGVVNRITKRATVLVESPEGIRYSNGRNYKKYYVPLALLEPTK